jgi:hypothetical protein
MQWVGAKTSLSKLLALFHRERPEALYMAMTAYLDESGTHGKKAATVVLGGFISNEAGWTAFERDLDALLKANNAEYFHAKKLRKRSGPFKYFTEAKKALFVTDFFDLVDKHLAYGFAISLSPKDFLEIYRAKKTLPKKMRHDSQYGLCFRLCMVAAYRFMSQIRDANCCAGRWSQKLW